jgi:CYTH domain-containing protein
MDAEEAKYTRVEYERRFLVAPQSDWQSAVESYSKTFEDKYLRQTRLRLRVLTDSDSDRRVIKLTKKAESSSPYFQTISRILLSPGEYDLFEGMACDRLTKTRYYHSNRGRVFSIDVFAGELAGLVLCEVEAETLDELMAVEPPAYAWVEVTEDAFFTGGNLCRVERTELLRKLAACGSYNH